MKISVETLALLKNFSTINNGLVVGVGSQIRTVSISNDILAEYNCSEEFPTDFAIYELSRFLGAVSLMKEPDFEFSKDLVDIQSVDKSVQYVFCDSEMVKHPTKKMKSLESEVNFKLTEEDFRSLQKVSSVLSLTQLFVEGDGENIKLVARSGTIKDTFVIDTKTATEHKFKMIFNIENLKLFPGDYTVGISFKGAGIFTHDKLDLKYFIAVDPKSKVEKE